MNSRSRFVSNQRSLSLNCEALEDRQMLSTVQLLAAGFEGTEQFQLQIDQVAVQTWTANNLASVGATDTFTFETPDTITPGQIRVEFINDTWDPDNGIDSNLLLDAIVLDGVRYETESPSVFSTGTWLPADGIQPGFRESEILHTNGYFEFADSVTPPSDVEIVINEIHYNPGPDGVVDGDAEFIELYNPGSEAVDLSGMSFVGFDLTIGPGVVLGAGEYAIVAPSISLAESTWGVTPIAEFTGGGISGGGELIQLIGADGVTVIDEVEYSDSAPWPGAPDGNGPSLELRDPSLDNSLPESWATSNGDPTPAAENSVFGDPVVDPITISVTPGQPLPGEEIVISATIEGATTATLTYKIMQGDDVAVDMVNVGGNVWQAVIAGQDAGTLVRYRVDSDVSVAPFNGDTINYFGVVVQSTDIVDNQLPLFQFFVDEAQFEELTTTDLALTNTTIPVVIVWDGEVYDNATVRVRGGDYSRANFAKKSLKFEMPDGYTLDFGTGYGVDEFGVNADFGDWTFASTTISWDVWNNESKSQTQSFAMRVENNGQFHGVFRFQELYDGAWRDANGHSDDQFFKADAGGFGDTAQFDKKDPDDGDDSPIDLVNTALTQLDYGSEAQQTWLSQNVDIPSVVNHMALSALMRHDDQIFHNFYMAQNRDTSLWTIIEWDLDRLWINNEDAATEFTDISPIQSQLMDAVFAVPEYEAMYWRRMQTLVDTYLNPTAQQELLARRDEIIEQIGATNSQLEFEKWGRVDIYDSVYFRDEWIQTLVDRATAFANETRLPGSPTEAPQIVINELHYNPLDENAEFIELYNAGSVSVDLSGWTIDGVNLEIQYGTVIMPGQYLLFSDNLPVLRSQNLGDVLIAGQYPGGLSGGGEAITLFDRDGNVVDAVEYDDSDPWPSEPDGDGYTLELIDPALDNSLASSWQASSQFNGTAGRPTGTYLPNTEIQILAAGATGNEVVQLEIGDQPVATFLLSAYGVDEGDLETGQFSTLTWISETPIDISQVRVRMMNDFWDPDAGIDYGVRIDYVAIDGVIYETESPDVYSTGVWVNGEGVVPGFLQTEILNTAGYFQYGFESNESPVAVDDSFAVDQDSTLSGNLLVNDSDPDGDSILVQSNTDPANGSLALSADGSFSYTPNAGFDGVDSFEYSIADSAGNIASASVTITVSPVENLIQSGNIIQLTNLRYDSLLAGSYFSAFTSTSGGSSTQWRLLDPDGDGRFLPAKHGQWSLP